MSNSSDDDMQPVTRNELREELAVTRNELREELAMTRNELREELAVTRRDIREDLAALEVKFDGKLSMLVGALLDAIKQSGERLTLELGERLTRELGASEQRMKLELGAMKLELGATEHRLMRELGVHTRSSTEELTGRVAVVDEKYQDLAVRVTRLEAITPAPRRRSPKS